MTATVAVPHRRRRPDGVRMALAVFSTLVFVFLFLPIVFVIAHSFTDSNVWLVWDGSPPGGTAGSSTTRTSSR